MTSIEWKKWTSKKDNPFPKTDIIVRRDNGDVVFAYYAEMSCYFFLTYKVDGDMIQTYVLKSFFNEGEEWAYVESLQRQHDVSFGAEKELALKQAIYVLHQHGYTHVEETLKSLRPQSKQPVIEEIKEALLSEVLPCFMHGGEADEVVAKLDEVLEEKSKKNNNE